MTELNVLKSNLSGMERKTQGNLMVRGLADLVSEEDVMESEYMTTVYVVVPKASMKEFESSFEKMATYVVPRSAKLLSEDSEYGLYLVVLFKKSVDEFKASAREKRFTMREFTYDPTALETERQKKASDEAEYSRLKGMLTNWCLINYSECYIMMIHLKAVRVFCESVLRYGLTPGYGGGMAPNFKAFLLHPKKGVTEKLRKALAALYSGTAAMIGDAEEETVIPGATGEFYPYVYTSIETGPRSPRPKLPAEQAGGAREVAEVAEKEARERMYVCVGRVFWAGLRAARRARSERDPERVREQVSLVAARQRGRCMSTGSMRARARFVDAARATTRVSREGTEVRASDCSCALSRNCVFSCDV